MPEFIPGLKLNELFFQEVVYSLLQSGFPHLLYSAGLIGFGSDVIGFDTPISMDHMWGPRMVLIIPEDGFAENKRRLDEYLQHHLPREFRGFSTNFSLPDSGGIQRMEFQNNGPVNHLIFIHTLRSFLFQELQIDPDETPEPIDWLTFSEHRLFTFVSGKVFNDDLGLGAIRDRFSYYPREVWLYLLASEWQKISQEEAFVGRTGSLGDDLGSRLITSRLVHSLMRLCFLMEKKYAPYSKWFGSAFLKLGLANELNPIFSGALQANTWQEREHFLGKAYIRLAQSHNDLSITQPLDIQLQNYYNRPFRVIFAERYSNEILKNIDDSRLSTLRPLIGSVNQFSDSTDWIENVPRSSLKRLYQSIP